jgi:hypothetical protein
MANVYDLHLRSISLNRPRRPSDERPRISGSHPAVAPGPSYPDQESGSKSLVSEPPPKVP